MDKFKFLLFVDDDLPTNYYHEIILKEADVCDSYKFYDNAEDALEFLAFAKDNDEAMPDIVFLDINMPKIDGWMFLEMLTKMKIEYLPVIIMLTTSLNPADKQKANGFKFVKGFNNKPLTEQFLLKAKQAIIDQNKTIQELLEEFNAA